MNLDSNIKNEVLNDFEKLLSNIDFKSYRPNSPEFSNALYVGLMWKILEDISEDKIKDYSAPEESGELEDDISEELFGAKKYIKKFNETSDIQFKQMAIDELRHAGILIKKEKIKNPDNEKLNRYEDEQRELTMSLI